jgi:hypothetical protein
MRLFFFGTLMDAEVRDLVIGRTLPPAALQPAEVRGFRRVFVAGRAYPMLVPHPPGRVAGIVASGIDAEALRRLQVYEGEEYRLETLPVRTEAGEVIEAGMFMCPPDVTAERRDWRLDQWQRRYKRRFLAQIRALMEHELRRHRSPGIASQASR